MKPLSISEISIISTLRFFAHLFSILLIFVVLLLAIGEGFPGQTDLNTRDLLMIFSLLVMLGGLLTAWKREGLGGIMILAGFSIFFIVNSLFTNPLRLGFFFLLFPLTGIMYLFCCWKDTSK